jgi:hypothetical protein
MTRNNPQNNRKSIELTKSVRSKKWPVYSCERWRTKKADLGSTNYKSFEYNYKIEWILTPEERAGEAVFGE